LFKQLSVTLAMPILFGPFLAEAQEQRELLDCLAAKIVAHQFEIKKENMRYAEDPLGLKPKSRTFDTESGVVNFERELSGRPATYKTTNETFEIVLPNENDQTYVLEKYEELAVPAQKALDNKDWNALYDLGGSASRCPKRARDNK
jgi:hypothetical protein